jgi:hypothetical protein
LKAGDVREWTSEEEEDIVDHLATSKPSPDPGRPSGLPASRRSVSTVRALSHPDHLAALSTPTRRLAHPTVALDPWNPNPNKSDPDCVDPREPAYLTDDSDFVGHIYSALLNARRNDALSHPVLGIYLPVAHAHVAPNVPPLSCTTLHDAACAATTGEVLGLYAGITDPEPDYDPDVTPTGVRILPGHHLSLAAETPAIIKWCQQTGLHKQARLKEPVSTTAPRTSAGPPGPLGSTGHSSSSTPATGQEPQALGETLLATRQEHPAPVAAATAPHSAAARQNLPGPVATTPAAFFRRQKNLEELMRYTDVPVHTENPYPWQEEPRAMLSGPMQGVGLSWICDPRVCLRGTHDWIVPAPVVIQRGDRETHSGWATMWYTTMVQYLQGPKGNSLRAATPDDFPTPVQAWLSDHVAHYVAVKRGRAASVDHQRATLRTAGGGSDARYALQTSRVGLVLQLHVCRPLH